MIVQILKKYLDFYYYYYYQAIILVEQQKSEVVKINMKDALMLAVQITPEERTASKEMARKMGMTYSGWLGLLVRRELKSNYSSSGLSSGNVLIPRGEAGEIRDSALL